MYVGPEEAKSWFRKRVDDLRGQGVSERDAEEVASAEWRFGTVFHLWGYPVNVKDLLWAVAFAKMLRGPKGPQNFLKMLEIFDKMLGNIAKAIHPDMLTTAYGALFLQGLLLRRFGLITDADFGGFVAGIAATNTAEVFAQMMDAFPLQFKINLGLKR